MADSVASMEFSAGGVISDSRYYAGAVEALRSACAQIGEAADTAQRAGFFADIDELTDEADASAHDADKAAVMAMAEALRAKEAVAGYADAARQTLAEVTAAFAAAAMPSISTGDTGAAEADAAEEDGEEEGSFSGHLSGALVALAEQRENEAGRGEDDGYSKLAQTLSVLADARAAYRDVDEALILLANARTAYLKESEAASQTAVAADIGAALADDIRSSFVGEFRSAVTTLAVTRTAYNAEVADGLWSALAEAQANLAAATSTVFEIQAAAGDHGGADDVHAASALAYSFSDSGTPTDVYDAARDVVIEAKEHRRRAQSACDAVDALLVENRAVAADALIEARAVVGAESLFEIRAAYDTASAAMDALFGARAAFEVGFDFTLPEIFGDLE